MSADVVKLPTAAPRQVRQRWNKQTRELRAQLPQLRDRWISPGIRKAAAKVRPIREAGLEADRQLLMAIFRSLDSTAQLKVEAFIELSLLKPKTDAAAAKQALAIVQFEGRSRHRTYGESNDIEWALRMMDEGKL